MMTASISRIAIFCFSDVFSISTSTPAALTVVLSLTRSPFWHKHVAHESAFGSFVVKQFPAVKAVADKHFKENFLLFRDLRRPDDPDPVNDPAKPKR